MPDDGTPISGDENSSGQDDSTGSRSRRRGITIYSASDAVDNATTGFRGESTTSPEVEERMKELRAEGYLSGVQSMCLFRQTAEEGGFSALVVWGKPNYPLPRHSHMSDCMYFVISGSATMGNRTLRPGDSFYAPEGAPYQYTAGPEGVEILEVRRNVDVIGTDMTMASTAELDRNRDVILANRDEWEQMTVSPLFAANRAGAAAAADHEETS